MNKTPYLIIFIHLFFFTDICYGSPTSSISQNKKRAIIEALEKDDHQLFQKLLREHKAITQYDRFDFLYTSLSRGCFPKDIQAIMNKNHSPFVNKLDKTPLNKGLTDRIKSLNQSLDNGYEHRSFDIDSPGMIITSLAGQLLCYEVSISIQFSPLFTIEFSSLCAKFFSYFASLILITDPFYL